MPATPVPILPEAGFNRLALCRHGPMLFNRHDQYVGASLATYGEFSPGEMVLFAKLVGAGAHVVEVGANSGAHPVGLAQLVGPSGRVHAFEPQRIVFQTLCANLALNSCTNVLARHEAAGAEAGEILVPALAPDRTNNFGGLSLRGATSGERVTLRRLDDLALPACHLLKIDAEGMEVEVLRGAAASVAAHSPFLYVENDRTERAAELVALLLGWNYQLYWHTPPLFEPENFAGEAANIFGVTASLNLLCVAAERNITVQGLRDGRIPL
ncbi:MAG: FkbM family methyltransferase [Rhodospirillales bacterium]|nr:FkbM family methyltransferase [Rhodospirillales bacterium]